MQAKYSIPNKQLWAAVDSKQRGELLIRDQWEKGTDFVIEMWVFSTDTKSYQLWPPENCLATAEREKKLKYPDSCIQQQRHLSPFVESANGLLGLEDEATLKRMAGCLNKK